MIFSLTQFNQWSILKFNGSDKKHTLYKHHGIITANTPKLK